jgi:hypothetical protein
LSNAIDIVYPLGLGSQWNNNELRYSLRSIERYGLNIGNVYVVGLKLPEWLNGVKFIKRNIPVMNYHAKIADAYNEVCKLPELSNDFIIMNDDFFLIKEVDFVKFGNYERDFSLKDHLKKFPHDYFYGNQIRNTVANLTTFRHFDNHYPMKLNKEKYLRLFERYKDKIIQLKTILIRSLYGNYYNIKAERMPDLKINKPLKINDIKALTKDRYFFSIGDLALNNEMKNYLQELYPNKSKYEI